MGRFNNYQSDLVYTPQTFEKLSVLPMMLRKRQDDMEAQNDLIELNIANTKVAEGFQEQYDAKRADFEMKSKSLAERMAAEGAGNPNLIKEFQNLKRQYNKDAAATGIFGMGKKEYEDMDAARKMEIQYGVEKAGQNPAQVAKKVKEAQDARQVMIKAGLAKDAGFIPEAYVPEYAPKAVSVTDFAKNLQGLIGKTGYSNSTDALKMLSDGTIQGADGMLAMNTKSDAWVNNKDQLIAFVDLMNSNLLDKTSPLNQHLRYNDADPKDYVKDVQRLSRMMSISDESHSKKINSLGGGSGSGTTTTTTGADNDGGVIVQKMTQRSPDLEVTLPTYNGGAPVKISAGNVKSLMQKMENAEQANLPIINTKEYATQKQAVIDFNERMNEFNKANKKQLDDAFKKTSYYSAKPNGKYNKFSSYDEFLKGMEKHKENAINDPYFKNNPQANLNMYLENTDKEVSKVSNDLMEKAGIANLLYSQNIYGFGFNDASAKLVQDSSDYLKNNAQFIKDQMGPNSFAYDDITGDAVDFTEWNPSAAKEMKVTSVATKNGRGAPSIGIEMRFASGEDGTPDVIKRIDLEIGIGDGVARGVVEKMLEKTKDPKTQYVLQSVLDSADANQVIPDSKEYEGAGKAISGASKAQSDMIITFNAASSTGRNKNTINKQGSYQLLSEGPHYILKVKQKGDLGYRPYSIGDLIYDRVPRDSSYSSREIQDKKNAEVRALSMLMGYDPQIGVESFTSEVRPITPESNGAKIKILSLALNDYLANSKRYGATQSEIDDATNTFIERTKNIGLKTMNKAAFLKH